MQAEAEPGFLFTKFKILFGVVRKTILYVIIQEIVFLSNNKQKSLDHKIQFDLQRP